MIAPLTILRAVFMYVLLVIVARTVGRRPGKQYAPFEFVLVFFLGGLALTAMVGTEASITNAFAQIVTIASLHLLIVFMRSRSERLAKLVDCTSIVLFERGEWRHESMRHTRITQADVMSAVREQSLGSLEQVRAVVLERSGDISVIPEDEMSDGHRDGASAPPVDESQAEVEEGIAVGEDLQFQRKWWRFERIIWWFFAFVILADVTGLLGNGPLSKAHAQSASGALQVDYERVIRNATPGTITVHPRAAAIQDGKLRLFVSQSVVKGLGMMRVTPQPSASVLGNDGITYEFPIAAEPATVQLSLEPTAPGVKSFTVGIPGGESVHGRTVILP